MQPTAGSIEAPSIKIIFDGFNGVCIVKAKMKDEHWALEDDGVKPGSSDGVQPTVLLPTYKSRKRCIHACLPTILLSLNLARNIAGLS